MTLLIDMNLSPRWASYLVDAGIEAAHWSTLGAANAPNVETMAFARVNGYVVLTHDLDFNAILAVTHGLKPSVVHSGPRMSVRVLLGNWSLTLYAKWMPN